MTFDDAAAALSGALAADDGGAPAPAPAPQPAPQQAPASAPQGSVPGATEPAVPVSAPAEPAGGEDTDFIGRADLDALLQGVEDPVAREAITRAHKSFQGAFTRKTQELAEQRKQYESLGDPNDLREALQLRQTLQDPSNWLALHAELTTQLQALGLTPAQASAEATRQLEDNQPSRPDLPDLSALDDPELAPIKAYVEGLRHEMESFRDEYRSEREAEAAQRHQMALVGEMQRQENVIRTSRTDYEDRDIGMVYELSSFHGGNLLNAHQSLEDYVQYRLQKYVGQKESLSANEAVRPIAGGSVITESAPKIETLDQAFDAAMEHLRQIEAQDT